jgi:DnaJ-domain-containing protein 1
LEIDSIDSYKKKLTELNLSNYIVHRRKNEDNNVKALSESKLEAAMQHEEESKRYFILRTPEIKG